MSRLADRIVEYLRQNPSKKFTNRELAEVFVKLYADDYENKRGGIQQLSAEVNKEVIVLIEKGTHPQIKCLPRTKEHRKLTYWDRKGKNWAEAKALATINPMPLKTETDPQVEKKKESTGRINKQPERDLYEPLIKYLKEVEKVNTFTIQAYPSKKGERGRGKGIHPDIVGVQGMAEVESWDPKVGEMAGLIKPVKAKLWSFELKKGVTRNDVYQCYQQAISNSSWANFGYLCVGFIDESDTEKRLEEYHQTHGIGVILIKKDDPLKTNILIKARERNVNLNFCNTLAPNKHFKKFLNKAVDTYKTGNAF